MRRLRKGAMTSEFRSNQALWKSLNAAVRGAAVGIGSGQRLIDDAPYGPRAPPALRAATETAIDLAAGSDGVVAGERRAHVLVGKHVAGTDDHCGKVRHELVTYATILSRTRKN
jgi:hypothetical protein